MLADVGMYADPRGSSGDADTAPVNCSGNTGGRNQAACKSMKRELSPSLDPQGAQRLGCYLHCPGISLLSRLVIACLHMCCCALVSCSF